jgi:hypothetical protein
MQAILLSRFSAVDSEAAMTPEEREQLDRLVERIKEEKNQAVFADLVRQFQELIKRKEQRLQRSKTSNIS